MPPILRPALILPLLAGCAGYAPVTRPPVAATYKQPAVETRVTGFSQITLRSVEQTNTATEVPGARCTLDSAELAATVTTPAIVMLPKLQGQPGPMRIDCKAGSLAGETLLTPQRIGGSLDSVTPRGVVGAVVSTAVSNLRDEWTYAAKPGATTLVPMIPQGLTFDSAATLPAAPAPQRSAGGIE